MERLVEHAKDHPDKSYRTSLSKKNLKQEKLQMKKKTNGS